MSEAPGYCEDIEEELKYTLKKIGEKGPGSDFANKAREALKKKGQAKRPTAQSVKSPKTV